LPQRSPSERKLVDETFKTLQRAVRADHSITPLTVSGENVTSAAFTPDGRRLVTGTNRGSLIVWNVETFQKEHHVNTGNDTITQVDISSDGRRALASGGKMPGAWDIRSGKQVLQYANLESAFARTARFSPDGARIALGYSSNRAEVRDAGTGKVIYELRGATDFGKLDLARALPAGQFDAAKLESVAQRLRIVPRQLPAATLVRLYRAVRDWSPPDPR